MVVGPKKQMSSCHITKVAYTFVARIGSVLRACVLCCVVVFLHVYFLCGFCICGDIEIFGR